MGHNGITDMLKSYLMSIVIKAIIKITFGFRVDNKYNRHVWKYEDQFARYYSHFGRVSP